MSNEVVDPNTIIGATADALRAAFSNVSEAEQELAAGSQGGTWPFISQVNGQSRLANPPHEFKLGTFALTVNKEPIDLGKTAIFFVAAFRDKASGPNPENPQRFITSFDKFSDVYANCKAMADAGDSNYRYGTEVLLYESSRGIFCTMHFANKTLRNVMAYQLGGLLGQIVAFEADNINGDKGTYYSVKVRPVQTQLAVPTTLAAVTAERARFLPSALSLPAAAATPQIEAPASAPAPAPETPYEPPYER